MKHTAVFRAISVATITSLSLVAVATASVAAEANLILGVPEDVLTLPAGDGVRDTTTVQLTSNVETTVAVTIRPLGGGATVKTLDPVGLSGELLSASVEIPVNGLPAGRFELVATPTEGPEVFTEFLVGSGDPESISLSLSSNKIYTWSKATPRTTTATVFATDETEREVPFTGSVVAVVGGKTYTANVKSTTGATATAAIPASKLNPGTGRVTAHLKGTSTTVYTSDYSTLHVLQTAVTGVTLKSSVATVFPAKDGYNDTAKITVTPKTTTGKSFAATGKVTITRNGKTVKSWKLTAASAKTLTWDGKVKGKIVPGTYTVKVSLKGPEGGTKTTTKKIKVDKGKLVTKTKTVNLKAKSAMSKTFYRFDYDLLGQCAYDWYKKGDYVCAGLDLFDDPDFSLVAVGKFTVPSDVRSAQKYGGASATVTLGLSRLSGSGEWAYYNGAGGFREGKLKKGKHNLGKLKLPATTKTFDLVIGLHEYSMFAADTFSVKYTYKVMKR